MTLCVIYVYDIPERGAKENTERIKRHSGKYYNA